VINGADSLSHRTMLMVLYSTGMRNAELRHLQVADIDSRRMLIHIQRGKGGRDRYVPLSSTLLTTLHVYYRWMRPKTWLFPGIVDRWRADKPITPKVLWDACVVAARRVGVRKRCSPRPIRPGIFPRRRWLEPYRGRDVEAAATSSAVLLHGSESRCIRKRGQSHEKSQHRATPHHASDQAHRLH
jgi:integrase